MSSDSAARQVQHKRLIGSMVAALPVLALAGCVSMEPQPARTGGAGTATEASATVAVERVYREVDYYGACGNEVLRHEGMSFYPLLPEELDGFNDSLYQAGATSSGAQGLGQAPDAVLAAGKASTAVAAAAALPAVPAPRPGDDVGVLTVYQDGMAHFISDSGSIETWLTEEPRRYSWVC